MRQITIPQPFIKGTGPDFYTWRNFAGDFLFFDVRWMLEDWAPAFSRLRTIADAKPGKVVSVEDADWEKLCECVRGSNERMNPNMRLDLIVMAHAVTCATKKPDAEQTQPTS